jgi:LEA14-like dessication related protein
VKLRRRRHISVFPAALVAVLLLAASCTDVKPPEVTLTGAEFDGITAEGLSLTLLADVSDPNGFGGTVRDLDYTIFVDGEMVAHGRQEDSVVVPSEGIVEAKIPFTLTWSGAADGLKELASSGEHEWRIKGSAKFQKGGLSRSFRFDETGNFNSTGDFELDFDN